MADYQPLKNLARLANGSSEYSSKWFDYTRAVSPAVIIAMVNEIDYWKAKSNSDEVVLRETRDEIDRWIKTTVSNNKLVPSSMYTVLLALDDRLKNK